MEITELIFGPFLATFIVGVSTLLCLYWYSTRNHDYWKKLGVPYVKPLPFIGSIWDTIKQPLFDVELKRYREHGPIYGHFEGSNPVITVGDPKLLRDILVKDFQFFTGRRVFESNDTMIDKMMSVVRGEDWKRIRSIVTPTFSTGKIKRVVSIFRDCANTVVQNFKNAVLEGKPVDVKRLYSAFTMDIIASAAFSTKIDSHNDPNNQFVSKARNVFRQELGFKFVLFLIAPIFIKLFKIRIFAPEATDFFREATFQIIKERKRTGQVRNDFLQLLMDTADELSEENKQESLKKDTESDIMSNYGESDAGHQIFKTNSAKHMSMEELVAQCVIFFLAGYDTTGSTLALTSFLLAVNSEVQDKLREEIDATIVAHNGRLTYEGIQSMKYLDNVISETLRLYTPVIRLERMCDADYKLGDTGITIKKGTLLSIPTFAMHRDPALFKDPEKFNPDRFNPEEKSKWDPYAYLPFGAGPRNCVGMRFALVEVKLCLALVLSNFKIKKCAQTKDIPEFYMSQQGLLQPKDTILEMEIREDSPLVE